MQYTPKCDSPSQASPRFCAAGHGDKPLSIPASTARSNRWLAMLSKLTAALVAGWFTLSAHGQPSEVRAADRLPELLRLATTEHPNVKARRNDLRAAGFDVDAARWSRYPSLATELQTSSGRSQAIVKLEQPLWTGGRITGQINLASAKFEAATAGLGEAQTQALMDTALAFFELSRLDSRLGIALLNEEEHQKLLATIERRVKAEVSPLTDQTQAGTRLRQAINERIQIQRQRDNVRFQLEQNIGRPVKGIHPPRRVRLDAWTPQHLIDVALNASAQRRRLQAQVEAAQAEIQVTRSQLRPQVVVGYSSNLGQMSNNERRGQVYLALQLQTANGLANLSATEAAVARKAALEDAQEIHQRELAQQIQTLWGDAQTLASQVGPVKALLTGSNEVVESYLRQFQVGRKNWLDVLNAQREKTQAQYALADIESPLLLTHAQLLILTGTLTPQNLDTLDE